MRKLLYAQDLIKTHNTSVICGFNQFIKGEQCPTFNDGYYDAYERIQGWEFAKNLAKTDGIAFRNRFRCKCGSYPIMYGGSFCCNHCGRNDVAEKWWEIIVEKDGQMFCCHGLDFINLQESYNYAFGDTFELAIEAYEKVMIDLNNKSK